MTAIGDKLNGYKVPYAIAAVLVTFTLGVTFNACARLSAIEIKAAQEEEWRKAHMEMSATRVMQLDSLQVSVNNIEKDMILIKSRQEAIFLATVPTRGR